MTSHLNDIESYTSSLDSLFTKLVKNFNKIQLADHTKDTIKIGTDFLEVGSKMLTTLKHHVRSIETLLADCSNFVDEITEDLTQPKKEDGFVYHTKNGMLSFPGREFIIKKIIEPVKSNGGKKGVTSKFNGTGNYNGTSTDQPNDNTIDKVTGLSVTSSQSQSQRASPQITQQTLIPELGYHLKVPVVSNFSQIPPSIYYVKSETPGLFIRLPNDNIVKIPFPEVVDSKKEYDRKHSIRCKYRTKSECDNQRSKMAKFHNSPLRICNFAHESDTIVKIGYPSRCPAVPNFGNPKTMSADIKHVTQNDIKNVLLYGLSDLISGVIWLDYAGISKTIFANLETA